MFDHLTWWQVLVVLAPITGLMHLIRWREMVASSTSYKDLVDKQKAFLLLSLMPPGVAAKIWLEANPEQLEVCMRSAADLRGSGRNLHDPVMKEFLTHVPKKLKDGEASDLHERFCNAFRIDMHAARKAFMTHYGAALGTRD